MINVKYIDMQAFLREKIKDASIAKKATSIALGIAISRMLPLPSSAMEQSDHHYATTLHFTASMISNEFNENIVIDNDLVAETARSFWMIRYTCAYPSLTAPLLIMGDFGFISKINNVGRFINRDTYAFCDSNNELMIVLVNRLQRLLREKEVN